MLSVPKSKAGDEIMLPNLAKINLMLQGKSDIAFTMQVRVLRSQTKLGDTVIVTTHGTQFESFLKHEYVYIKARLPCMLQQARATPSARGEAEYEADGRTYKGLLLNYSGTSCNIVVKNAINVHQLLSLEAKFDGEHVEDCVVMAMNVVENKGAFIIHANFVRMSEKLRNYILAHIYLFTGQGD
jgi:hypothetical protein